MDAVTAFLAALANPNVPFIRYALVAGLVSSAAFGTVGSIVVVRRISYVAGAVSHAALAGLGGALYLSEVHGIGWLTPMMGAMVVAVASAWIIAFVTLFAAEREDTIIGAIWAVGMAIGLVFIFLTPGYVDAMSYLFGNILLIGRSDLVAIAALTAVVVLAVVVFYPQLQSLSFDGTYAETRGTPVWPFTVLLYTLAAITVVLMVSAVGIVMVIALLTLPAATAGLFARRLSTMMILGTLACALTSTAGLVVSFGLGLPTGATTIIVGGAGYLLALVVRAALRRAHGRTAPG